MEGASVAGAGLAGSIRVQTHGFRVLFAALLVSLVVLPWAAEHPGARVLAELLPAASLAAVLYATSANRRLLGAGLLLFVASLLGWWRDVLGLPSALGSFGLLCGTVFLGSAATLLWRPVFRSRRISEDTLVGTVCVYLLLCLAFANTYLLAWRLVPGSFSFATEPRGAFAEFLYFSLVTLTTLGYGDVLPVGSGVRSLVILESVMGILYPAIAVARLVALHAAGGEAPPGIAPSSWRERHLRNLLVLVAGLIVVRPILAGLPAAWVAALADSTLLVVVLYGMRESPRFLRLAVGPAAGAVLATWWAALGPAGLAAPLGFALQVLFYAIALLTIAMRALRESAVTRDMLLGACCAYLLIAVAFEKAFALLEFRAPGSIVSAGAPLAPGELIYFSFMTLTTTGFGDITPASSAAHLLAGFEAGVGIFYPVILVARLVALYGSEDPSSERPEARQALQ